MKPDLMLLIKACQAGLSVVKPVEIVIKTHMKGDEAGYSGWCETIYRKGKVSKHKIFINLEETFRSEFNIYGVIAHEFVHCAMIEHGMFNPEYHHDKTFQDLCEHLSTYLTGMGFDCGPLYSPETDVD